jgi:5-methylcytosine-specific restriction endonuclease McrA
MTIDRKDNAKGYEPDNVVACCFNCNRIKGSFFSADEMKFIAENLIKPKLKDHKDEVWDEWVDALPDYDEEDFYE